MSEFRDHVTLGELSELNPESLGAKTPADYMFKYIDLSSVTCGSIDMASVRQLRFADAPSRARRVVRDGDVLFGTVRPQLRPHARVAGDGFVASTGFCVTRPKPGMADGGFLGHYLLSDEANRQAARREVGSNYPAITERDVAAFRLPRMPLEEQRRIAEILDTIDEAIQATERVIAKLTQQGEGLEARFLREGGQVAEHVVLAEVASVDRGKFSARPRNNPSFYGGEYPFIQTGDVTRAHRRTGIGYAQTLNDLGLAVSRKFQVGTIAVTIAANIADTAILDRPMCFPDSVVGVTVSRPNSTRWIEMCIHAAKPILRARAPQSAQKNINLQDLRPLIIPVPDPARQHVYAELWEEQLRSVDREMLIVAKLNRLRSGLGADLLSGRVRTVAS